MFSLLFRKKDKRELWKIERDRKYETKEYVSVKASDSLYKRNDRFLAVTIEGFTTLGYTYLGKEDSNAVFFVVDRVKKEYVPIQSISGWPQDSIDIVELAKLDLYKKAP